MRHAVNLLPQQAFESYTQSRRYAVFSRVIGGIALLFLVAAVFAGASLQYLATVTKAEGERLEIAQRSEELKRAETFEERLRAFSSELSVLRVLKNPQYDPSMLVRQISEALPVGASLQAMTMSFGSASEDDGADGDVAEKNAGASSSAPQLFLTGIAGTRGDILDFQHALEELPFVESVDAPLENIIKPTDAAFSFSLILVPPDIFISGLESPAEEESAGEEQGGETVSTDESSDTESSELAGSIDTEESSSL